MEQSALGQLAAFNQLYKEMDKIYHLYAKRHGLSDAHLWMLYSLYESEAHTQREICAIWHYSPQTVNSALKSLETQVLIVLTAIPGNKKNKLVGLTEKGKALTQNIVVPLILAEQKAFEGLMEEEREALVRLTSKYTELLQTEVLTCLTS